MCGELLTVVGTEKIIDTSNQALATSSMWKLISCLVVMTIHLAVREKHSNIGMLTCSMPQDVTIVQLHMIMIVQNIWRNGASLMFSIKRSEYPSVNGAKTGGNTKSEDGTG